MKKPPMAPVPRPRSMMPAAPQYFRWPMADSEDRPETKGTGHMHWGITAYHELDRETGQMLDSLSVEVEADSEPQAIARAQEIVERPWYRVSWVKEACAADKELKD